MGSTFFHTRDNPIFFFPNLFIISASWHLDDVTQEVHKIAIGAQPVTITPNVSNLGPDPAVGVAKALSITYGYFFPDGHYNFTVKACLDNEHIVIYPGPMSIIAANWGGADITEKVRSLAAFETVQLDTSNPYHWPDPWPTVTKTFVILYYCGNDFLKLFVAKDNSGIYTLSPTSTYTYGSSNRVDNTEVLSVGTVVSNPASIIAFAWGLNNDFPLPSVFTRLYAAIGNTRTFKATNENFHFDGWVGFPKTAVIFYRNTATGPILMASAREGETVQLP